MQTTILYKYLVSGGTGGSWNVASRSAAWRFYDNNDGSSSKTAWFLEIEQGDIDMHVSNPAELQADLQQMTATFFDAETACVCKLRFPDVAAC